MGTSNRERCGYWVSCPLIVINGNFVKTKQQNYWRVCVNTSYYVILLCFIFLLQCKRMNLSIRVEMCENFCMLWKYVITGLFKVVNSCNSNVGTKPANKGVHYFYLLVFTLLPWWGTGDWCTLNHLNSIGARFSLQKYWQNVSLVASPEVI